MSEPDEGSGRGCRRVDAEGPTTRRTFLTVLSVLGLDTGGGRHPGLGGAGKRTAQGG